ncbi:hypothetical protein CVS47_00197 [Microbacterium lemovicicum]|uniref:Uncharacterized protein n=1 Tax=Microbacterium lemovicicum TaxID=1072463 RepID=A0A3Q9IYR3_9MICO|nr:hypothetical protein [Microbacterium lemovicicum]AZS35605.1 hypothetical protein CVS47_00197 [Microbacterium lemovicicum]
MSRPIPGQYSHISKAGVVPVESVVALLFVAAMAVRVNMPLFLPWNVVVALLVFPIAARHLTKFEWMLPVAVGSVAAGLAGVFLTEASTDPTSFNVLVSNASRVLGWGLVLSAMLWARSVAGVPKMLLAFAVGQLLSLGLNGVSTDNAWKFSLSFPVILLTLSLPVLVRSRVAQLVACLALAAVSVASDSRSSAGFLLISIALVLSQGAGDGSLRSIAMRRWLVVVRIGAVALGAFFLLQAALLEGFLGEQAEARTAYQIQNGGSVLAGGRPEMGASVALILAKPFGYGAGAVPEPSDILVAKGGMSTLGYDPNNGYVENYMFGRGFEVHSVLGNLWIQFGILGAIFAIAVAILLVRGAAHQLALGTATAVMVYLAIRGVWDIAFSPTLSSFIVMPLALAAVAVPKVAARHGDPLSGDGLRARDRASRRSA